MLSATVEVPNQAEQRRPGTDGSLAALEGLLKGILPTMENNIKELSVSALKAVLERSTSLIATDLARLKTLDQRQLIDYIGQTEQEFMEDFLKNRSSLMSESYAPVLFGVQEVGSKAVLEQWQASSPVSKYLLRTETRYPVVVGNNYWKSGEDHLKATLDRFKLMRILQGTTSYYFVNF